MGKTAKTPGLIPIFVALAIMVLGGWAQAASSKKVYGAKKRTLILDASPIRSKESDATIRARQSLKLNDINDALSKSFMDRKESESEYESNTSAGRPRNLTTDTARIRVELGDGIGGGWELRRNDSSHGSVADRREMDSRMIEARLDREVRQARYDRGEVRQALNEKQR